MIKRQTAFVVGQKVFATLEEAQEASIAEALQEQMGVNVTSEEAKNLAHAVLGAKDKIIDALTTTETSLPSARKINGGRKPRKPKPLPIIDASETAA